MSEEPKTRKLTGYLAAQIIERLNRAGSAVQDWDVRLSNARPPTPHAHPAAQISDATPAGRELLTRDYNIENLLDNKIRTVAGHRSARAGLCEIVRNGTPRDAF